MSRLYEKDIRAGDVLPAVGGYDKVVITSIPDGSSPERWWHGKAYSGKRTIDWSCGADYLRGLLHGLNLTDRKRIKRVRSRK